MIKKILLIILIACTFVGCSKHETTTLTLVTPTVKTNLNGKNVVWNNGDRINVNGNDYTITVSGDTAKVSVDISPDGQYYAYYPADGVNSFTNNEYNVTLSSQYVYRTNSITIPLAGYSNGGALVMSNIMSMLVLHIDTANTTVNDIMIATGGVSGTGTITCINTNPRFSMTQPSRTPLMFINPNRIKMDRIYVPILPLQENSTLYILLNYTKSEQFGDFVSEIAFTKRFEIPIDCNNTDGGMQNNVMYHINLNI